MYKQGARVVYIGEVVAEVLGPADFEGYGYNNPTKITGSHRPWLLIRDPDGTLAWIPERCIAGYST